ncbi:MlaD family protein [Rhodococcoides corynebacterioides]|uniref:MCE family protein n=1 Tax=Rhodococcoides corynebacterioides TaxID=53972 RepID=A0ABS7P440_9NOCA|nr:MlaD family protein [Rhodococcus corynebacterioides]MBY6367186.1 MCE family protein [Rhodococcus corynebacterioides]MBY6407400.1 MCE family protein [Rhodococcus corynebacterioides]
MKTLLSVGALVVVAVLGVAYLALGVLDMDPRRDHLTLTVPLTTSGGLIDTSQVTLRGAEIGRVERIDVGRDGLEAVVRVDAADPIPRDTEVRVSNLSAAGEQFLDFRPRTASGPFLSDGDTVDSDNVVVSPSVSDTLAVAEALTAEIDTRALGGIVDTVDTATRGREPEIDNVVEVLRLLSLTLQDKKDVVRQLYYNLQVLGENAYADSLGPRLADTVPELRLSGNALEHLIGSYQDYSYVGETVWDGELGRLVPKIDEYLSQVSPDLGFIATVLRPVTRPIRPLRVDAGALVTMLEQVFPRGGPARVSVTLPPN